MTLSPSRLRLLSLVLAVFAVLCLVGAFAFPFVHATFRPEFPSLIPDWPIPFKGVTVHEAMRNWLVEEGRLAVEGRARGTRYLPVD